MYFQKNFSWDWIHDLIKMSCKVETLCMKAQIHYRKGAGMAKIDHAAIRTESYEEAQKFFEDIFDMHMWREIGEKPGRKCWYKEGIQLCETETIEKKNENGYDHISIAVDRVEEVMERVKTYPVEIINDHWFALPNGTKIELKLLENWKLND